jgi:hypothetical protein
MKSEQNPVTELNKQYTYAQIAQRIYQTTGRRYSEGHIGNVARGSKVLSDSLMYNLTRTFPEVFLELSRHSG